MTGPGSGGNVLAALCSLFIPGLGQLLQGRLLSAACFFVVVTVSWWFWFLMVPIAIALLAHLLSIIDAARYDPRY